MRLKVSRSKNAASLYVTKTVYENNKEHTITVEKLGTEKELREKLHGQDPFEWARDYINELNEKEKAETRKILIPFSQSLIISKDKQFSYNGGYLFLQDIYHKLGLHKVCKAISSKHFFEYNLDSILSRLIFSRIIFPSSKLATFKLSRRFLEQPDFELHQIYRALSVIAEESDFIQQALYKNSLKLADRKTGVIYYDCTNFFFEIEQADVEGSRQYGVSKEHRPNPIVQMGMFMDGDGIPLAFCIDPGNTNEQVTLRPLEKKLISDFSMSRFVVCTDAGLASTDNRKFNNIGGRSFITTQSVKKLKKHLKEWALAPDGWHLAGESCTYDITKLDNKKDWDKTFFKERWIKEDDLEQKLIVTYSLKYRDYQKKIRDGQILRAQKVIDSNPDKIKKCNSNDYRRLISKYTCTADGEVAENEFYAINTARIAEEEKYDGYYAVCSNLEDDAPSIIRVNHRRWEIEECFRIMKSEFEARPAYLSREERIKAHFMTCFIALIIYRFLEKKLEEQFTCPLIIQTLKDMNFYKVDKEGYIPTYTRTDVTDALHEVFGFRTDYQINSYSQMKKIFGLTKK